MDKKTDIHKAAGVIIKNRRLLVVREAGKDIFFAPGGKLDPGETAEQAVIRELEEEFGIKVSPEQLSVFGTFYADAAGKDGVTLRMDAFKVDDFEGEITPSAEIEDIRWVSSANEEGLTLGSIFEHEVIPKLKEQDLID